MNILLTVALLTTLGYGLTSTMRQPPVETSPVVGLGKVEVPKPLEATASASKAITETFKQPVAKAAQSAPASPGGDIEGIVRAAARKYGLNEEHFLSIARCESNLNVNSINHNYTSPDDGSNPTGVFQFIRATYIGYARMASFPAQDDRLNAFNNVNVAAWAFANGKSSAWECT